MPSPIKEENTITARVRRLLSVQDAQDWFRQIESATWLPWLIIGAGILLRFREYLFDRSMWLDESFVALDIIHTPFRGLFKPIGYNQAPPVGFALLEKLVVGGLGTSEFAFRLIPLLAGLASLLVFYHVAKRIITPRSVPIALGIFAISWALIYYSSETKQYSLDVLIALALYAVALPMVSLEWTSARVLLLSVFGALAIWVSQPSLFILGGIGLALAIDCATQKRWTRLRSLAFPFSLWGASFALCYWTILRLEVANSDLLAYWNGSFAPFPPHSMKDINWYINTLFQVFSFPVGIPATGLAVVLFAIGSAWLLLRHRVPSLFLLIPIVLTLAASAIHKYPFSGRLILFLVPAMILPVAEGVDYVRRKTSSSLIAVAMVTVLFLVPVASATRDLVKGYTWEDIRPVINYIRTHDEPGDVVYLSSGSEPAYSYYNLRKRVGSVIVVRSTVKSLNESQYAKNISQLQGHRRVWIVFSHLSLTAKGKDEMQVILDLLNRDGKRIDSFHADGASTYLYDMKNPPTSAHPLERNRTARRRG